MKLYQALAEALQAHRNSMESNNDEWAANWRALITLLQDELPSGSGFDDDGCKVEWLDCTPSKIIITTSYHGMNDSGMYDRVTDYTVTVTPSFSGFDIRARGPKIDREYILDCIAEALNNEAEASIKDVVNAIHVKSEAAE